jgi:hypothetical protein
MTVEQLPRILTRSSLVLAPLIHLASTLVVASLASGAVAEVAACCRSPARAGLPIQYERGSPSTCWPR